MATVIVTAQVEDSANWEEGFRTHGELFNDYTSTAIKFTSTAENEIAIHWEVDDLDKFLELTESPRTIEAMEFDGIKRDTVKFFVLDKELDL
jgi:cytochrome c2